MSKNACQGCGGTASDFQCPLCLAEAHTDKGFFCSQECFAQNWLAHRNECHKSGVVREKKKTAVAAETEEDASSGAALSRKERKEKKAAKRERAAEAEPATAEASRLVCPPWMPLPQKLAKPCVSPSLALDCPRAVVAAPADSSSPTDGMWPSLVAAAHYVASSLAADAKLQVLVAAADAHAAHAFGWAARCAGLTGSLRMAVSPLHLPENPADYFTPQRRVVIATTYVLKHVASGGDDSDDAPGAAARWLATPSSLLVTLPGVADAGDLQGASTRAVFFTGRGKNAKKADTAASDAWTEEEKLSHTVASGLLAETRNEDGSPFLWCPIPTIIALGEMHPEHASTEEGFTTVHAPGSEAVAGSERPTHGQYITPLMDNDASTSLVNGDVPGALQHLVRVYSAHAGRFEEILFNTLCCDWGAMGVVHAHHRLAYMLRCLVDHGKRFASKKGSSLADVTCRAMVHAVRLLPPLLALPTADSSAAKKKAKQEGGAAEKEATTSDDAATPAERSRLFNYYDIVPNLQLQATICYVFEQASPLVLDTLASAWGITKYLAGDSDVQTISAKRTEQVHRLRTRYGTKLSPQYADYLVVLMHIIYDAVAMYSQSVEAIERRLLWGLTLAYDVGPLSTFLANCALMTDSNNEAKDKKKAALSSRQTSKPNRVEQLRGEAVKASSPAGYMPLPWKPFPLCGQREREVARLQSIAVEEILMAMPRVPRPMYIGDVGNLIGKWFHFNARFDGVLGVSLSEFLGHHPDKFTVAGKLVTRRTAGKGDQVRMRFDQDEDPNDSDDDGDRKARDRAMLTGKRLTPKARKEALEKELPSRARKKRAVKEFNSSRFNRNYKQMDPSARVPGYVKHAPRKIKGRGKKANKRLTKRN